MVSGVNGQNGALVQHLVDHAATILEQDHAHLLLVVDARASMCVKYQQFYHNISKCFIYKLRGYTSFSISAEQLSIPNLAILDCVQRHQIRAILVAPVTGSVRVFRMVRNSIHSITKLNWHCCRQHFIPLRYSTWWYYLLQRSVPRDYYYNQNPLTPTTTTTSKKYTPIFERIYLIF